MLGGDTCSYCHDFFVPHAIVDSCVERDMISHCYFHMASHQHIDAILLISCFHACAMPCASCILTICTHAMIAMITSSMLHLCTTSLLDLITMLVCYVASPMFLSYLLSWVDDIYVHATHMIYIDHCHLPPIVASLIFTYSECNRAILVDIGDFDTLLVMHTYLIEPIALGCYRIMCLHVMPLYLVLSYDKNDASTCWVFSLTNCLLYTSPSPRDA